MLFKAQDDENEEMKQTTKTKPELLHLKYCNAVSISS